MAVEASANKYVTHSSYLVTSSSVQHIYPIGYRKLPNPSLIRICSTQTDSKLHWRTFVRTSKHILGQSLGMTHMHGSHVARRLIRSLHCLLPYLLYFVFCVPRIGKSERFGEFCVCWLLYCKKKDKGGEFGPENGHPVCSTLIGRRLTMSFSKS